MRCKYPLHKHRAINCESWAHVMIPPWVESRLPLLVALVGLTFGSVSEQQHIMTCGGATSLWFPHCSGCIMYAARTQYLALGERGARHWLSASPHAPHMSQWKLCALYICISSVLAAQIPLFLDITSKCSVGFAFFPIYKLRRLMNA